MDQRVDLYDSHYDRVEADVYRAIRRATYGVDLGQTSWITADECRLFCTWLDLRPGQRLLELACGSGGTATWIAETLGVSAVGTDVNALAVKAAQSRRAPRTEFLVADADGVLPFPPGSFDAVFCNDAILHFRDRLHTLRECWRVLRPGGRCLYTDPVVVTGLVSKAELEARSSIGYFTFSAPGVNERVLAQAGFRVARAADVTPNVVETSRRWREARQERRADLLGLEGEARFEGLQGFLQVVHLLASEARLSRIAFVGERIEPAG